MRDHEEHEDLEQEDFNAEDGGGDAYPSGSKKQDNEDDK
jgi:hypothetical protein